MDLNKLKQEVFAIAQAHGWYDTNYGRCFSCKMGNIFLFLYILVKNEHKGTFLYYL